MNQYEGQESNRKYDKEMVDLFNSRMYGRTLTRADSKRRVG
jgi:hypothetical protein